MMNNTKNTNIGTLRIAVCSLLLAAVAVGAAVGAVSAAPEDTDLTQNDTTFTVDHNETIFGSAEFNSTDGSATITLTYAENATLNTTGDGTVSVSAGDSAGTIDLSVSSLNSSDLPAWTESNTTVAHGTNVTESANVTASLSVTSGTVETATVSRETDSVLGGLLDGNDIAGVSMPVLLALLAGGLLVVYIARDE